MAAYCKLCYTDFSAKHPLLVPRMLNCSHTICTGCISKLQDIQGQVIECPFCHENTILPENDVEQLDEDRKILGRKRTPLELKNCLQCIKKEYPPKPALLHCVDCDDFFCGSCSDERHINEDNQDHSVNLVGYEINPRDSLSPMSMANGNLSLASPSRNAFARPCSIDSNVSNHSSLMDVSQIPVCTIHDENLTIYCRTDRTLCCPSCELIGEHQGHDCFQVHEAEERERVELLRLKDKVDLHCDKHIRNRGEIQRNIEEKKNSIISAKDMVKRYFREIRVTAERSEQELLQELTRRNEEDMDMLRGKLSEMIQISSTAKSASRKCEKVLSKDYYQMLSQRSQLEQEMISVLHTSSTTDTSNCIVEQCQFPKHESLLHAIRTCAFILKAPNIPRNVKHSFDPSNCLQLQWQPPYDVPYTYPVMHYTIEVNATDGSIYDKLYTTNETSLCIDVSRSAGRNFCCRISAVNIIGQGRPAEIDVSLQTEEMFCQSVVR